MEGNVLAVCRVMGRKSGGEGARGEGQAKTKKK